MNWIEITAIVIAIKLGVLGYFLFGWPAVGYVLQGFLWIAGFWIAYQIAAEYWSGLVEKMKWAKGEANYRIDRSKAFGEWTDRKDATKLKGWF